MVDRRLMPCAAALLTFLAVSVHAQPDLRIPEQPAIGSVKILVHNVFDMSNPKEDNFLFRATNNLHVRTKEVVIRRELLFEKGDPFDPRLLSETERNLRRLPLFRKVKVEARPAADGTVNVEVHVYDNWTITPTASFKRAGGEHAWKMGVKDTNILGYGKTLGGLYSRSFTQIERNYFYEDPQFLGRRLNAGWGVFEGNESKTYRFAIAKPFLSSLTKHSLGASFAYSDAKIRHRLAVIDGGHVQRTVKEGIVNYGRSLGSTPSMLRRANFRVKYSRERLKGIPGESVVADDPLEVTTTLEAGFTAAQQDFIKEQNITRLFRDEDINLGWVGTFAAGVSPRYLGASSNGTFQRYSLDKGVSFGRGKFLQTHMRLKTAMSDDDLSSILWNIEAEYYHRFFRWNTLAVRAAYDYGHQLNPPDALRLGETEGLRGYGLWQFSGNRRMRFNVEDRMFFLDNLFRLLTVGGVVFFDAGTAWMGGQTFSFKEVKTSVGTGLRLGSSRGTGGSPLRIDVAYGFNGSSQNTPWSVSILTGQAF